MSRITGFTVHDGGEGYRGKQGRQVVSWKLEKQFITRVARRPLDNLMVSGEELDSSVRLKAGADSFFDRAYWRMRRRIKNDSGFQAWAAGEMSRHLQR